MECTCHRIFLATLIVAGKYLNDASPKNKYWARYSTVFTVAEVNLMEKQLLYLLDFDLRIDNDDLNVAVSTLFAQDPSMSAPLTPTTPPAGTVSQQPHVNVVESEDSSSWRRAETVSHPTPVSSSAAAYPPTLGLPAKKSNYPYNPIDPSTTLPTIHAHENVRNIPVSTVASSLLHRHYGHGRTHSATSMDVLRREPRRLSQ